MATFTITDQECAEAGHQSMREFHGACSCVWRRTSARRMQRGSALMAWCARDVVEMTPDLLTESERIADAIRALTARLGAIATLTVPEVRSTWRCGKPWCELCNPQLLQWKRVVTR